MTAELIYFAKVTEDGTWEGISRKKLHAEVKNQFAGRSIEILIRKKTKQRSVKQNNTQWLYFAMISEVTGYAPNEVKGILQEQFLKTQKVNEKTGAVYDYVKQTSELTTVEHCEFTDHVKRWAAQEWNLVLPDPEQQIDAFVHGPQPYPMGDE